MLDLPKISRSGLEGAPLDDELEDLIVDFISLHSQKDEASGCYHFLRSDIVEYCENLAVSRNLLLFFNGEPSLGSLAAACYEYDELWMDLVGSAGVIIEVKKNLGGEILSVGDFSVDEWGYSKFVGECIAQLKQSFESP